MQYKTIKEYLSLPWSYQITWSEDLSGENWTARVDELQGCMSHGKTPEEAITSVKEAIESYILSLIDANEPVPEPVDPSQYKGQISYRTKPEKHFNLAKVAKRRGVSINKLIDQAVDDVIAS